MPYSKYFAKQNKLARITPQRNNITSAEVKAMKKKKKKKKK